MITGSQIGRGGAPIGPPSSPEPNHNQPHDENDEDDLQCGLSFSCWCPQHLSHQTKHHMHQGKSFGGLRTFFQSVGVQIHQKDLKTVATINFSAGYEHSLKIHPNVALLSLFKPTVQEVWDLVMFHTRSIYQIPGRDLTKSLSPKDGYNTYLEETRKD